MNIYESRNVYFLIRYSSAYRIILKELIGLLKIHLTLKYRM